MHTHQLVDLSASLIVRRRAGAAEAERLAVERFTERLPKMGDRDLVAAVRSLAQARGTSVDKGRLLRGEPTQVIAGQRQSEDELWAKLRRLAPGAFIEGTAEEEPRPELADAS